MVSLIDPHYHTKQSDGEDKIIDSIIAAKRLGLAALVITDHLSANRNWIGPTRSYSTNKRIMKMIRSAYRPDHYPIILGVELYLPPKVGRGEVLVFGTGLCDIIQKHRIEISNYDFEEFKKLKERYECAIVQCHPDPKEGLQKNLLPILDGCEITYGGIVRENFEQLKEDCKKYGITPIVSSDGHNCRGIDIRSWLGRAYNIISIEVNNEKDWIMAIKENKIEKIVFNNPLNNVNSQKT